MDTIAINEFADFKTQFENHKTTFDKESNNLQWFFILCSDEIEKEKWTKEFFTRSSFAKFKNTFVIYSVDYPTAINIYKNYRQFHKPENEIKIYTGKKNLLVIQTA